MLLLRDVFSALLLSATTDKTCSWASAEIFPGGQPRHFAYSVHVADDAMQMHVHKTL